MNNWFWYQKNSLLAKILYPVSCLFGVIVAARVYAYQKSWLKRRHFPVPIIVIGNITAGGNGKTPLTLALAQWLQTQGYRPGIVSRGYGGNAKQAMMVDKNCHAKEVGDEAIIYAKRADCPVAIAKKRVEAVALLLQNSDCNIVLSDDGLQHYAMARDIEIIVIDSERGFGNGKLLPAGPLREPIARLETVDYVIYNGTAPENAWAMQLQPAEVAYNLADETITLPLSAWADETIHAVAGIANPDRFFRTLVALNLTVIPHAFPDHYFYHKQDLHFDHESTILMTEKDAVKCSEFADYRHWYLPVTAQLPEAFTSALLKKLRGA